MAPQKRFGSRQATGWESLQLQSEDAERDSLKANELHFGIVRSAQLLVCPKAAGAGVLRRQRLTHAAFCSVSASTSSAAIATNESARSNGNGSAQPQPQTPSTLERLPVAIKKGDQLLPYIWDGKRISAMDEAALQDEDLNKGRFRNWVLGLQRRLKEAFLPDPQDVSPDYWEWLRWRLTQRFFSSTMQNFSFSALLMATGLGAKKALAASAAINWLLKDGVSRIVRMTVSTSFGQTFDADLKRMRFVTSLIFTACMAGEFATPFWPQHFVLLASISSVGRAIGLSAFVATQPAFQAALGTGGNLADLTSKTQAQHMVMDMLALGVSASLTWLCRGMPRGGLVLPAIMYPLCSAGDLTCIFHELKAVQLRTLNRERAEMVIERWIRRGSMPDAAEISAAEHLVLPSDVWQGLLPLRITPLDRLAPADPDLLRDLLREYNGEEYVLRVAGTHPTTHAASVTAANGKAASASSSSSSPPSASASAPPSGGQHHRAAEGVGAGTGRGSGSAAVGGAGPGVGGWLRWLPWIGGGGGEGPRPEVFVALSDRATPRDITKSLLHAAYLRKHVVEYCRDHFVHPRNGAHHHKHHHHHHQHRHQHHHPPTPHKQELRPHPLGPRHQEHSGPGWGGREAASGAGIGGSQSPGGGTSLSHAGRDGHDTAGVLKRTVASFPASSSSSFRDGEDDLQRDTQHPHPHLHAALGSLTAPTASLSLSQGASHPHPHPHPHPHSNGSGTPGPGGEAAGHHHHHHHHNHHHHQSHDRDKVRIQGGERDKDRERDRQQAEVLRGDRAPSAALPLLGRLDEATWADLIAASRREAERDLPGMLGQVEEAGWKLRPFMLNTTERVTFVRL